MITGKKVLNGLVDSLNEMSLSKMAGALQAVYKSDRYNSLDHLSFLSEIVTPEYNARMETRLNNRLSTAHLKGCPEDIAMCVNSAAREYKPDGITETLGTLDFIDKGQNVCILGSSDIGKSYLAKALGILACSRFSVEYHHCEPLVESLAAMKAKAYDKYQKKIRQLTKRDLLIIDDFLLHSITDEREIKVLFEIMEKRSELGNSTIICSQREPKSWTAMIYNDEVASNALLKRATKHFTVVIAPRT